MADHRRWSRLAKPKAAGLLRPSLESKQDHELAAPAHRHEQEPAQRAWSSRAAGNFVVSRQDWRALAASPPRHRSRSKPIHPGIKRGDGKRILRSIISGSDHKPVSAPETCR